ncbi:MAG: SPASM domain-containing protein [Syntrophobacteraceae bacterium]
MHACRKFPSPIGNLQHETLSQIYDSESAQAYRDGSLSCRGCVIRPVCGGCLASSFSFGLDVFNDRDPFCFMRKESALLKKTLAPR